jgi:cephalosporin-C deacetylase-like acetyl esterase
MSARPEEFKAYWQAIDDELSALDGQPVVERMPVHSTDRFSVYALRLTSLGPYRIFGYLSVPTGDGPFPALLEMPFYRSVNNVPNWNDRLRYVVLTVMHRGQRLADQPLSASDPGLLTQGIDDQERFVYRGIIADCLRSAEYLRGRPEVDPDRIAVTGTELAVLTAARRPYFRAVEYAPELFYRAMEARERTKAYPLEELNDYLRQSDADRAAMERTLALYDPVSHAPDVRATTVISFGDDELDSRPWLAPLLDALGGPYEGYRRTYRSGQDADWVDACLARMLGTEPMSRFEKKALSEH